MAGIAILLDLIKKGPTVASKSSISPSFHSHALFSATIAATAASLATPGAHFFPRFTSPRVAHCDAGILSEEDYISSLTNFSTSTFLQNHSTKEYNLELKPLFSAFYWRNFALTSLRAFLLFYLPLLEPQPNMEEDDDFLDESETQSKPVNLVVPFKKSVKQIVRETTVMTTRRLLERLSVHYVSHRLAWKLLKDVPKSAARKAGRRLSTPFFIFSVSRTTLRGHFLGILASWLVQVGIDVYRFFSSMFSVKEDEVEEVDRIVQVEILGRKIFVATLRCVSSLVFASIGAGIGAKLIRPTTGQWIGCAVGDLMGPIVLSFCSKIVFNADL